MKIIALFCMSLAMMGCSKSDYNYKTEFTSSNSPKKDDPYEDSVFNRVKETQGGGKFNEYGTNRDKESYTMEITVY